MTDETLIQQRYELEIPMPRTGREERRPARRSEGRHGAPGDSLRILWVKVGGLWPANTGGRLRSFHILSELSRRHQVTVLTTHQPGENPGELERNLPRCRKVSSLPYAPAKLGSVRFLLALFRSWFTRLPVDLHKNRIPRLQRQVSEALNSGDYDLCIADFLFAVPNVSPTGKVPVIFFSHNVEHMIWQRLCRNEGNFLRRLLLEIEWRKMRRYETAACARADLTITVSEADRERFRTVSPGSRIQAIPTGVDTGYFRPSDDARRRPLELVFTGSMDWHPNEDAMLYFIESILPGIRGEMPDVSLTIVGRNPSRKIREAAANAAVQVTGTVDDIRPFVERAAVYVVPLRIGGGTRLKIFEALAMGKAVVSTTIGAEGLPLAEGKHILRADDPAAFATKVLALLKDGELRRRLGGEGRRLMEERYSWASVTDVFESCSREALKQ